MTSDQKDPSSEADLRLAEWLSEDSKDQSSLSEHRRRLAKERTPISEDLLKRLNALDFVNSLVGEATDIPEILGDYRITGLLGRGGMGTVYQAYQESLEREVALKVLLPAYSADPMMRKRFRSEARATASLHHLHIVPIYDYGEAGGCLYFAMEKVNGVSLDRQISAARHRGRPLMTPREAARRFAGVADALGHAHKRRLLHRDVKPGNILVQEDGTLALADFGLSKVLGETSQHLTATGQGFLGTLHFASPEQALGRELTSAGDLYSLGVTMFEAVTGQMPITGKNAEAVLQCILHGTPLRLRDCLPRAPRDLEAVLDKLLSKEPEDRYDDGEVLARDLSRVAEGEPVRIRRQPVAVRLWRRARKNLGLTAAVATVVTLLLLILVLLRGIYDVENESLTSRHGNLLSEAMNEVRAELGPAAGPPGLLAGMTGIVPNTESHESSMIPKLDDARELLDNPTASLMQSAYLEDPHPTVTELLGEGRGYEALQRLDRLIDGIAGLRDSMSELQLYRLYVARAVANLTRSVSRPGDARMDLARATLLRPGAFFSNVLTAITDWQSGNGAGLLIRRLDRLLDTAPAGGDRVVGSLLLSLADIRPSPRSNLADFSIPYVERRALHLRAVELLGTLPENAVALGAPTGLEADLADHAKQAMLYIGDELVRGPAVEDGRNILAQFLTPECTLQAWGLVFGLLDPNTEAMDLRDLPNGDEMSPEFQIEGLLSLLQLQPSDHLLGEVETNVASLRSFYGDLPGLNRLEAVLYSWIDGDGAEAYAAARKWVQEEPENPDALLYRFKAGLRTGELDYVANDGAGAILLAADREAVLGEILAMLDDAQALYEGDQARLKELKELASSFQGTNS